MGTITVKYSDLINIVRAINVAFLESGKYTLTRREANAQFGVPLMDALITNKLLEDYRPIKGERLKCRYLISDIITAIEIFNTKGIRQ